jgi:Uma2 family endonuclease
MKRATASSEDALSTNGQMSWQEQLWELEHDPVLKRIRPKGLPWACNDEESKMGESTIHTLSVDILLYGLLFHFALRAGYRVFANLNLYFSQEQPNLFLTPDVMVVRPPELPAQLSSYRIGEQGPAPVLVCEVLSPRTFQEGDMTTKPLQYRQIGIDEYLVADPTGQMLAERLAFLRRRPDGRWKPQQDADGGVTSALGFRVVLEDDGQLRVLDAQTGRRYARPLEAESEAEARQRAEDQVRKLQDELASLRAKSTRRTKGNSRRPKP